MNIRFGSSLGLIQEIIIMGRHALQKREYLPYYEWYTSQMIATVIGHLLI